MTSLEETKTIRKPEWLPSMGGEGGKSFNSFGGDFPNPKKRIDGIRIWGGKVVDAIQIRVNKKWLQKHGGNGGSKRELLLLDNEYISSVECRAGRLIDRLKFKTNLNNTISIGKNGGKNYGIQPGNKYGILIDIKGRSGRLLDSIQFKWKYLNLKKKEKYIAKWEKIYGGNGGKNWNLGDSNIKNITGVRIYSGSKVDSIAFQIDNKWKGKHGGNGGNPKTLLLDKDEYINNIILRSGSLIDKIYISTNKKNSISCGGKGGKEYKEGNNIKKLVNARGKCGNLLDNIQFMWIDISGFKYEVTSFEWYLDNSKIGNKKPLVIAESILDNNNSSTDQSLSFSFDKKIIETSTFNHSHGFNVEIGVSFTVKTPSWKILPQGELTRSLTLGTTHTWSYGKTNSTWTSYNSSFTINCIAGKKIKGKAIIFRRDIEVPYKMTLKNGFDTYKESYGIWKGVTSYNLHLKTEDIN